MSKSYLLLLAILLCSKFTVQGHSISGGARKSLLQENDGFQDPSNSGPTTTNNGNSDSPITTLPDTNSTVIVEGFNNNSDDGLTVGSNDSGDTQFRAGSQFITGGSQGRGDEEGSGGNEEPSTTTEEATTTDEATTTGNEEPSTTSDETSTDTTDDGEGETVEIGLQQLSNLSSTRVASELTSDDDLNQLLTAGEDDTQVNSSTVAAVEDSIEDDDEETTVSKLQQFINRGVTEKDFTTAFLRGLARGRADRFAKVYALLCIRFIRNAEPTKAVVVVKSVAVSIVYCFQKGYTDTAYKAIEAFTIAVSQRADCVVIIKQITQVFISIIVTPYGCGFKGCYTRWF